MNQEPNISVYNNGQDSEDFPVLKAFQQYVDAEQNKARKRVAKISVLFGFALAIVVVAFVGILYVYGTRNQSLNDRLIDYAMKETNRQQATLSQVQDYQSAIKAMNDTLAALKKELAEEHEASTLMAVKHADAIANVRKEAEDAKQKYIADFIKAETAKALAIEAKQKEVDDQLKALEKKIKEEQAKLDKQREKIRQAEIDLYRRRMYPECYGDPEKDDEKAAYEMLEPISEPAPSFKNEAPTLKVPPLIDEAAELKEDDAIDYFNTKKN